MATINTPILNVMQESERLLLGIQPFVPTATEAVEFDPPSTIYQRMQFVISPPDDPVLGTGYHRERIEMQVFVVGEVGLGVAEVYSRAYLITSEFYKGKTFLAGDTRVHILETPQIGGTIVSNNRVVCPVLIPLTAEVYKN